MKVAIVGSGIAGLSAAWYLKDQHEVTIYERWPRLGMDAHSTEVDCGGEPLTINVPMRVFYPEYYPTLTKLYNELGIEFEPVQYSASFSYFGGDTYFRYRNYWLGMIALPFLAGKSLRSPVAIKISIALIKLLAQAGKPQTDLDAITIEQYLQREGYSSTFANQFLYPTFAGICTCSYSSVKAYPASIILEYLRSGLMWTKVNRLTKGTHNAASRLAASASSLQLNTELKAVRRISSGVEVVASDGQATRFDHVILATQANQSLKLLADASAEERAILSAFRYEKSRIVVHQEPGLAPAQRAEWAPVNFLLSAQHNKPMASILMNRIHPQLADKPAIFETWNPFTAIAADKVLLDAQVERPVVSVQSLLAINRLKQLQLQLQPGRRVWFCGSYVQRGIPLLESAAASACDVAAKLNALP